MHQNPLAQVLFLSPQVHVCLTFRSANHNQFIDVNWGNVIMVTSDWKHIGKEVFLKMNSNGNNIYIWIYHNSALYENNTFREIQKVTKVMFLSAKKQKESHEIELPMQSKQGKFNFYDLKVNDLSA